MITSWKNSTVLRFDLLFFILGALGQAGHVTDKLPVSPFFIFTLQLYMYSYLQERAVWAITNSDYRTHSVPLFTKLGILDIFQVNTFQVAKFMFYYCCLHCFSICLLQVVKCITIALEQQTVIDHILVVPILGNLQFPTKVPKFGILSQHELLYLLIQPP